MSIPKIIHYCWFGRNPKPSYFKKYFSTWQKFCPDYEVIEWNEENYDVTKNPYTQNAYLHQQWAFLTDYVRLDVIKQYGGVYLDTDVELLKPLQDLMKHTAFFGFEGDYINTGLGFGAEPNFPLLQDLMDCYQNNPYYEKDGSKIICTKREKGVYEREGVRFNGQYQTLNNGMVILPMEYMCPMDFQTGKIHITAKTISIHHFKATWHTKRENMERIERYIAIQRGALVAKMYHYLVRLNPEGIKHVISYHIGRKGSVNEDKESNNV